MNAFDLFFGGQTRSGPDTGQRCIDKKDRGNVAERRPVLELSKFSCKSFLKL